MSSRLRVGGTAGYLFRAEGAAAYCFVPDHCVEVDDRGGIRVDLLNYIRSGWSVRNLRLADVMVPGTRLFPDESGGVQDPIAPPAADFVSRLHAFAPIDVPPVSEP